MALPTSWVDKIFEKLALTYGHQFMDRWRGMKVQDVKTDWAGELAGFHDHPEAIAYALANLPADRPPTVLQFRDICRQAPRQELAALPAPSAPADPERLRSELSKLLGAFRSKAPQPRAGVDLSWADRIVARHEGGEKVSGGSLRIAREALSERGRRRGLNPAGVM